PASPTTTTTSTTTTTLPAGTCAPHSYPTTYWQRNWYIYDGGQGACLGTGPNQDLFNFDDNWQTGTLAYSRIDGIMFSSTRSFSVQGGGIFDFVVGSDDGSVLYVNGIARHNDWSNHDYREKYVQSELREGSNTLQLDYYEKPYNFFTTNKARVAFLGPYSSQTVDVTTLKSEYNDGEDIRANALLYGSGFQSGNYKIRFFLNGHDTGKSCSVTVSTTQASNMCTSTTSPPPAGCTVETDKVYLPIVNYLCSASIPSPGPGLAHELLAKVYINDFELLSPVWDAEPVAVNSAPAPTTTTTTVPSPQRCDTNTDCLISYGHDTATNIQYVCNSPQGLPTSNTAIGLNTCYVPPTCMGNQKYPDGSDIKSTLCRPSYCCSGELSSTIGGGSCVNPGGTRGSGNYLCVG
ncbi:MAG: hypothetical protein HY364_00195, partial [Candidatus Aenigmarchaeota archaeon]|nr:hypothetical protein [Candidatus Aenigmarchaeota archaeon]